MKVILLEKIVNLGNLGDNANVKSGYARNYLIPKGKAIVATKENLKHFQEKLYKLKAQDLHIKHTAKIRAKQISELGNIIITSKSGEKGKLFGSIGTRHIAKALMSAGININKNEIYLPNGSFRKIGNYKIKINLYNNINTELNITISPKK